MMIKSNLVLGLVLLLSSFTLLNASSSFYGTVLEGGANGTGAIFKTNEDGDNAEIVFSFSDSTNGASPNVSALIVGSNGGIYAMSKVGGASGFGSIYKYDRLTKSCSIEYSFNDADEAKGRTMIEVNEMIYLLHTEGGNNNLGAIFSFDMNSKTYSKVAEFDDYITGKNPSSWEVFEDGKLYGMCPEGGIDSTGTIFEFNPQNNQLSVARNFAAGTTPIQAIKGGNDFFIGFFETENYIYHTMKYAIYDSTQDTINYRDLTRPSSTQERVYMFGIKIGPDGNLYQGMSYFASNSSVSVTEGFTITSTPAIESFVTALPPLNSTNGNMYAFYRFDGWPLYEGIREFSLQGGGGWTDRASFSISKNNMKTPKTFIEVPDLTTVSTKDLNYNSSIVINPNPSTSGVFNLNVTSRVTYIVSNILGVVIKQGALAKGVNKIDLSQEAVGIYHLTLSDGRSEKLVKN